MKLKELRLAKGLSQAEFANVLNISQKTCSNYENETTQPDLDTLIKIAEYFNVSVDYLLGRELTNDIGYLSDQDMELIKIVKPLNSVSKDKVIAFAQGIASK